MALHAVPSDTLAWWCDAANTFPRIQTHTTVTALVPPVRRVTNEHLQRPAMTTRRMSHPLRRRGWHQQRVPAAPRGAVVQQVVLLVALVGAPKMRRHARHNCVHSAWQKRQRCALANSGTPLRNVAASTIVSTVVVAAGVPLSLSFMLLELPPPPPDPSECATHMYKQVRAAVTAIKARLEVGLGALAAAVMGGRLAAGPLLEELGACVIPLLGSPLVGGAALDAAAALAACLPAPLCARARQLAGCLAAVAVAGGGPPPSMLQDVLDALRAAVVAPAPPLPGPALRLIFPLLAAALSSGASGPSLDAALEVLGLHAGPDAGLPHGATLTLLYGALESAPATRDRVVPLLSELCRGLKDDELPAAVGGLLLGSPAVRGAALAALPGVPLLNKGSPPPDPAVCAVLALARRDVDDDNAAAAEALWHQTHCSLDALHATVLVGHLRSTSPDVRAAAASALADVLSLQLHAAPATLDAVLALASSASNSDEDDDDDRNGDAHGLRSSDGGLAVLPPEPNSAAAAAAAAAEAEKAASLHGVAAGLAGLAAVLPPPQVEAGLDFLVAHGLGAADEGVRADMLDAGAFQGGLLHYFQEGLTGLLVLSASGLLHRALWLTTLHQAPPPLKPCSPHSQDHMPSCCSRTHSRSLSTRCGTH